MSAQAEPLADEVPVEERDHTLVPRAQGLFDAHDFAGTEALLSKVVAEGPASPRAHLLFAGALFRQGKTEEAVAAAEAACAAFPQNRFLKERLARLLLKTGQTEKIEPIFAKASEASPDDAKLAALHADACLLAGDTEHALAAIERACALEPDEPRHKLCKIVALCAAGKLDDAKVVFRDAQGSAADLVTLFQETIAYAGDSGRRTEAAAFAHNAAQLMPKEAVLWLMCARWSIVNRDAKAALAALETAAALPLTPELTLDCLRMRARTLRMLGNDSDVIAVLEELLKLNPDDQHTLRELYLVNQRLGRDAEMRAYGQKLTGTGRKTLPAKLAAGLEALHGRRPGRPDDPAKLKWAWELSGRPASERDAWLAALHWGHQADELLRAWWLNAPERAGQIDELMTWPVNSALDAIPKRARCVAVTTHLGPMAGQVRYLQTCGRPFRGFGVAGPDPVVGDAPPMRIAIKGNDPNALRRVIHEIERGTLIGFAPDAPEPNGGLSLEFLGRTITISTFVPRLIYKHRPASVWCQALWRDSRIVLEVEQLPDPAPDETIDTWCRRWVDAYLERMARVLRGAPENLNLHRGIWVNFNPKFRRPGRRPQFPKTA